MLQGNIGHSHAQARWKPEVDAILDRLPGVCKHFLVDLAH